MLVSALLALVATLVFSPSALAAPLPLTAIGTAATEDFNTLASSGTTNTALPPGWALTETGGGARDNEAYGADTGSSNTGDTYSYGAAASTERAFGGLQSGTLNPTIGASFVNNTGSPITSLDIAYTGEHWRLGTVGRTDRIDFQISKNATSLADGTWTNFDSLDFSSPTTGGTVGARNGNVAPNRTDISGTAVITIPAGATFWIRWLSFDASGADDGLAVDDFSITPQFTPQPQLSISDAAVTEGDSGTTNANFTVSLNQPAPVGGVTFDIATADGSATTANSDYVAKSLTAQTIPAGGTSYMFTVAVNGDTTFEPNETFSVNVTNVVGAEVADGTGTGTIVNDDPLITKIHTIQGSGMSSPMTGTTVTIEGIVTGWDDEKGASVGNNNFLLTFAEDRGIFVQEEDADQDGDPATSEGIFVGFVNDPLSIPLGSKVRVTGQVSEKFNLTIIREQINTEPTVLVAGGPLPTPVDIDPGEAASQSIFVDGDGNVIGKSYYERLEDMRVRLTDGTANSGGTNKFGEAFLTPGNTEDRVFRTEPQPDLIAADSDAGAGNPSNPLKDKGTATRVNVDLFDHVQGLIGPLGFDFGNYKVMPQPGAMPAIVKGPTVYPYADTTPLAQYQIRIASFNVENFFPVGGALDGGTVSQQEYDEKRDRIVDAIDTLLLRPDIVAVQEVVNLEILEDVAVHLGGYTAYLLEGNDDRGIDVGFLVKDTVVAANLQQLGKDATTTRTDCADGTINGVPLLFDRPPLALDIVAGPVAFTIITNHFASKSHPDACRNEQAAFVRDRVAEIETGGGNAIVTGDLNAFEDETPLAVLQSPPATLTNLWPLEQADQRYSYAFSGKLQTLDHVLVTDDLDTRVQGFDYTHFDNDYYDRGPAGGGHTISDHDPPAVVISTDACLNGDDRETVFIGGEDTGVPNRDTGNGCTINDLIVEDAPYRNHGQFVSHVAVVTNQLIEHGLLTGHEKGQIQRAAAQADIP
jgi:hypothetical protein